MLFEKFAQGDTHGLFDDAGPFDMARDLEEFGAGIVGLADGGEPRAAAPQNLADLGYRLHVVDGGGRAIEA